MDAIRSYLESMFAQLPNTEAVKKAKAELLQMMEEIRKQKEIALKTA